MQRERSGARVGALCAEWELASKVAGANSHLSAHARDRQTDRRTLLSYDGRPERARDPT